MAKEISKEQLKAICRMKPTKADVAAFFECSEDTIDRRCKEYSGVSFAVFREQNMVHTRFDLIRKAMKMAETNPTMMIFCLKNVCNWADKKEVSVGNTKDEKLVIDFGTDDNEE